MVPTEILAEQGKLAKSFPDLPVAPLTGGLKATEKREVLEEIALRNSQLIVGTHALDSRGVHYQDLGLSLMSSTVLGFQRQLLEKKRTNQTSLMILLPYSRNLAITLLEI